MGDRAFYMAWSEKYGGVFSSSHLDDVINWCKIGGGTPEDFRIFECEVGNCRLIAKAEYSKPPVSEWVWK